jgi:formamidopyrimidine-DNA glycosylase
LGMSGRIRLDPDTAEKHDHVRIETDDGHALVLNDARRFGALDIVSLAGLHDHHLLKHLGPEPLGNAFHAEHLADALDGRAAPIKALLFDQTLVAGLGNIYICEALFLAGVHPERSGGSLRAAEINALTDAIRAVLTRAIEVGGSTLRDYVQVDGELGYFQHEWRVYGREDEPCRQCGRLVQRIVQSNRSSFFCASCQPKGKKRPAREVAGR